MDQQFPMVFRPRSGSIAIFLCLLTAFSSIQAAPVTVRTVDHPFDSDWPDVYLILGAKCAGCHRPGTRLPDVSSYESAIEAENEDGKRLIVPGQPEQSGLWKVVVWNHTGQADSELPDEPEMPPDDHKEWLTAGQLEIIARWIRNGALQYKLPATCSTRPLMEIDFPSAKQCRTCHPKQYEEWSRSMHAFAQLSPVFEAYNFTVQERTSGTIGTFCTRCHTPVGTALGENGVLRNTHRSQLSLEGITCVACHRVERPYYKPVTRRAIKPGTLLEACMYGPFADPVSDDLKQHPAAGSRQFKSGEFCSACHDITTPTGLRLEEAYSEWKSSPAARQGISCQLCHMGPTPGVAVPECDRPLGRAAEMPGVDPERIPLRRLSDHSFAGPDVSVVPDTEYPEKLDWMYEVDYRNPNNLTPYQKETLTELRLANRRQLRISREKRLELLKNSSELLVDHPSAARCSDRLKVHVDIVSKISGHNFLTGMAQERQAWVSLTLFDPAGRPVFSSGDLDSNGDLRDELSHEVQVGSLERDKYLLNLQGKFVSLTNRGTERPILIPINRHLAPLNIIRPATDIATSYGHPTASRNGSSPDGFRIGKTTIPPLGKLGRDYVIHLPNTAGSYRLRVKLNFRSQPPGLIDAIGLGHMKHLYEILAIDEYESLIQVTQD